MVFEPRIDNPFHTHYHALMRYSKPYHDAVALQRLTVSNAKDPNVKPALLCGLARAFVELEMLKLRIKMKPAPKPIDTTKLPSKQKRVAVAIPSEGE
jgi:hypothetical protein